MRPETWRRKKKEASFSEQGSIAVFYFSLVSENSAMRQKRKRIAEHTRLSCPPYFERDCVLDRRLLHYGFVALLKGRIEVIVQVPGPL